MEEKDQLRDAVLARSQALITGDTARMGEILADEFVYTNANGQALGKGEYMAQYVTAADVKWVSQDVSEVAVRVYGETGVVTCNVHDRAEFQGEPFEGWYRSLFVYVRREGAWRCVAGQTVGIQQDA